MYTLESVTVAPSAMDIFQPKPESGPVSTSPSLTVMLWLMDDRLIVAANAFDATPIAIMAIKLITFFIRTFLSWHEKELSILYQNDHTLQP